MAGYLREAVSTNRHRLRIRLAQAPRFDDSMPADHVPTTTLVVRDKSGSLRKQGKLLSDGKFYQMPLK
jgi:hypothetical protein